MWNNGIYGLKKKHRGVSLFGWSLVSTGWACEMMKRRPQTGQSSRVTRCQFIHVCKVLKSSGSGANVCWFVDRHQTRGWFTTLRLFTLLPIVVEKRAVRMSGRSSSLQPLLSKSLALDLYLACSRKQQNTHTHSMPVMRNCANTRYHLCPQSDSNYHAYINNSFFLETFWFKKHFFLSSGYEHLNCLFNGTDTEPCTLKTEFQLLLHQPVWDK